MSLKKILLFTDWFAPAYKAGGPIRSCVNFAQLMKDGYDVFVLTSDRDLGDTEPYENIIPDKWGEFEKGINIFYCSPLQLTWKNIYRQIDYVKPDFIYLNSMFSRYFTIYPLLMHRRGFTESKIVLAPRGMLRSSALRFKSTKKKIFFSLFRLIRLHRDICFHATDKTEEEDIRRQFGSNVNLTLITNNLPGIQKSHPGSIRKQKGALSVIFIGRLHPIKNLDYLLSQLPAVTGTLSLTIVGSEEDGNYTVYCKTLCKTFPENIKVQFAGEIPNHHLPDVIARHHIFALPTQGENFGHAIFEALAAGKPVLISDQTPWRNLVAHKAGWDIPLQQEDQFVTALQQAMDFDQGQYNEWSLSAWQYVHDFVEQSDLKTMYYKLFS